jgi:hypothetical protein
VHKSSTRSLPLVARDRDIAAPPNFMSLVCEGTHIVTNLCLGCMSKKSLILVAAQTAGACPSLIDPASMPIAAAWLSMHSTSKRVYWAETCHSGDALVSRSNSDLMRSTAALIPAAAADISASKGVARPHLNEESARTKSRPPLLPLHKEYAEAPLLLPDAVVRTPPSA